MSRAWNTANWTPAGGSITSLWYVCMYVCMYVGDKNFVNLLKIGAYNFNFNYQSNVEGHLPIDALVAPFGPLGPLGKAYQMTGTVSIWYISSGVMPKSWADDVISSGVMPKNWADDVIIWDDLAGSKNSMGQLHHTVILRWNAQAHGPWAYFRLLTRWFIEIALFCCFTKS